MRLRLFTILAVTVAFTSCVNFDDSRIWDKLNDHEERIEKLETLCNRLNSNVEALRVVLLALQENDYVTDVVRIIEDGVEIGYSITFAKSGTVTIYHGSDGADGATPKIGVKKASDGDYYWTSDGEWLTDDSGEMIPAVAQSGDDERYVTPQFRVSGGCWYVSFDNGSTWRLLDKIGNQEDEDQFFQNVDVSDPEYVVITMLDGTAVAIPRSSDVVRNYFKEELEITVQSVKDLLTEPCLIFPMLSDIHYQVSPEKPESIDDCANNILELSKYFTFDFIACLGDIVHGDKPQDVTEDQIEHVLSQFRKIDAPLYITIGNHDDNRYYKPAFTHVQLYSNYLSHIKNVVFDNSPVMCHNNYYKDFDHLQLRCIFLSANTDGAYGYSKDTCDWFDAVVEDSPYGFIVFTHIPPIPAQTYGAQYGTDSGSTRIRQTCVASDRFIMMFSGHNHYDSYFTEPFKSFTMNCQKFENTNGSASLWAKGAVKPTRTLETATEDCFDVVVVRPGSKKINLVRFGAGEDREFDYGEDQNDPSEEDAPEVGGVSVIDITSSFSWTPGTCTAATGNISSSDTYWLYSDMVDVSNYKQLTFTHCQTVTANTTLGYAFYDSSRSYISGATNAGTSYRPLERLINVPENATYFRCMWMNTTHASYSDANDINNFYCKGVRDVVYDESVLYGTSIACIGDSITYGVGADGLPYPTQLANRLSATVTNLGVSGSVLCTDGHRSCNISKLTLDNCMYKDIVTILLGINDWDQAKNSEGQYYYNLGDINSTETSCIYGAMKMWCDKIVELKNTAECADTRFYFMTPVVTRWNNSAGTSSWSQDKTNIHGFILRDLCNAIIDVCELYDIPVIDLNMYSGIYYNSSSDQNVDLYGGDGVHINQAGHTLMTDAIIKALAEDFAE